MALSQNTPATYRAFFPERAITDFEVEWYGKALVAMNEKPLVASPTQGGHTFRFVMLPTWGNPVAVRLDVVDGRATLTGKRLSGQGGYEVGTLSETVSAPVEGAALTRLLGTLHAARLDTMSTQSDDRGLDGSEWILESALAGKVHAVVRWTAELDTDKRHLGPFVRACEALYRASGLKGDITNKGAVELRKTP